MASSYNGLTWSKAIKIIEKGFLGNIAGLEPAQQFCAAFSIN